MGERENDKICYLDYRHTFVDIPKVIANDINIGQSCVFLDLSGSKIGDEGACQISNILRLNRSIQALSLRGCSISDIGVEALCEVVTAFTLTKYELAKRRQLTILEEKVIEDAVSFRLIQENEFLTNKRTASTNKNEYPMKNPRQRSKTFLRIKHRRIDNRKETKEDHLPEIENRKQRGMQLEVRHPLLAEVKGKSAFGLQILGNYKLSMVNLSRNSITEVGIRLLTKALEIQTSQLMIGGLQFGFGLTDIVIKNNKFCETDEAYMQFADEFERKRSCLESIN
nr:hypothetical transcript [Hymenolepis microstoma]